MGFLLAAVPLFAIASGILLYRYNGKRDILRLDLIQFFYAFVLTPVMFMWSKSILFLILKNELELGLTQRGMFVYDTLFSVFFMYIFAFVVLHSLTNTINQKVGEDPLYDIFFHLEYIHLWASHLIVFAGGLILLALLGILNAFYSLPFEVTAVALNALCFLSLIAGIFAFIAIIPLSNPKQQNRNFSRIMKVLFGVLFLVHVILYFVAEIPFRSSALMFWTNSFFFAGLVLCAALTKTSPQARSFFEHFSERFKRPNWEFRAQLFGQK